MSHLLESLKSGTRLTVLRCEQDSKANLIFNEGELLEVVSSGICDPYPTPFIWVRDVGARNIQRALLHESNALEILVNDIFTVIDPRGRKLRGPETYTSLFQVVLTGGPCSGKSEILPYLKEVLPYPVYSVPEVVTLFGEGGLKVEDYLSPDVKFAAFEKTFIETQLSLEKSFRHLALLSGGPAILIQDRGLIDAQAFLPSALRHWVNVGSVQYDLVLHLRTAAHVDAYTTENNKTRHESKSDALLWDQRIYEAWAQYQGSYRHEVIQAQVSFEAKKEEVAAVISQAASDYFDAL
jgi:hypothetical protein